MKIETLIAGLVDEDLRIVATEALTCANRGRMAGRPRVDDGPDRIAALQVVATCYLAQATRSKASREEDHP